MNTEGPLFYYYMFICGSFGSKISGFQQAQRRAAAETDAFIRVVRYNDESSFNLDNDFEMNPVSTKTWPPHGAHLDNYMGQI